MESVNLVVVVSAFITSFLALLVTAISLATDYWLVAEETTAGYEWNLGLWKYCFYQPRDGWTCQSTSDVGQYGAAGLDLDEWFEATQAAMCLAFLMNLAATVVLAVCITFSKLRKSQNTHFNLLKIVAFLLLVFASFWNLTAFIVFAAMYDDNIQDGPTWDLSGAWGLAIGAFILDVIAAACTFLTKRFE